MVRWDLNENINEDFDPYKTAEFTWLMMKQLYCVSKVSEAFIDHYYGIMSGQFKNELIEQSSEGKLIAISKKFAYQRIYNHASV